MHAPKIRNHYLRLQGCALCKSHSWQKCIDKNQIYTPFLHKHSITPFGAQFFILPTITFTCIVLNFKSFSPISLNQPNLIQSILTSYMNFDATRKIIKRNENEKKVALFIMKRNMKYKKRYFNKLFINGRGDNGTRQGNGLWNFNQFLWEYCSLVYFKEKKITMIRQTDVCLRS